MWLLKTISARLSIKALKTRNLFIPRPDQPTSSIYQRRQARARAKDSRLHGRPPLPWIWCIGQDSSALLSKCLLSLHVHRLSITVSHLVLLPIRLRPTSTTKHSICSLLRAISQDTPVIKQRLIFPSDPIYHLGTLFLRTRKNASLWDDRARRPNNSIPAETSHIL